MLKGVSTLSLTVGVSTYFAVRWLSPRLMTFMQSHPDVQLRIQPMIEFSEAEMQGVDLAIRWGNGNWKDGTVTPFMPMPSFPVGNADVAGRVERLGIREAVTELTLLRDREDSNAWSEWFELANLPPQARRDVLIVPDPNVRVQAVINGQGVALMDDLVGDELAGGKLIGCRISRCRITAISSSDQIGLKRRNRRRCSRIGFKMQFQLATSPGMTRPLETPADP